MLLQSLVLIATMLVISAALLMNGLYSAKAALHQRVMTASQTEMADATAQFVKWAQSEVQVNGIDPQTWPAMTPMNVPLCEQSVVGSKPCTLAATVKWTVSGSTMGKVDTATSVAENLSEIVSEQRISTTISVTITDPSGKTSYGQSSRELTTRLLNASPYAIVTALRNVDAVVGDEEGSEGDSGGHFDEHGGSALHVASPIVNAPSLFTYTAVNVTIDCKNPEGTSNAINSSPGQKQLVPIRSGGNVAFAFRVPCDPEFELKNIAPGFELPKNGEYEEGSSYDRNWAKKDGWKSSFAR